MVDIITAEIIRASMETTSAEIISTLVRSAVSPLFNEAHDCSAGIFYFDGEKVELLARADATPVHIFGALTSVQAILDYFQGDIAEGDVFVCSDPYFGGTHIADYTIVKPVFYNGQPMFFPSVRGHLLDTGGAVPAGFSQHNREIWHEGFRFGPMKLYDRGEMRTEVWNLLQRNCRLNYIINGDVAAMVGACRVGEERIRALCDRYGLETIRECVEWNMGATERRFRERIRGWKNGTYYGTSILDTDFAGGYDLTVQCAVTVNDDNIHVDFAGTCPQSQGIVNSVPGNTLSYVYMAFGALCRDIPMDSGFFRCITSNLPRGSIVNPNPPACAAYATICIGCDIGEALMGACEGFAPERCSTVSIDLALCWTVGVDARTGQYFIHYDYNATAISAGASKGLDGWGAWATPFCALTLPSVEMTEIQYPTMYTKCELVTDSPAPGQWRGAPSLVMEREVRYAAGETLNQLWFQGLRHPLRGYVGGRSGQGNYGIIRTEGGREIMVTEIAYNDPPLKNGESFEVLSCGGGGWGDPLEREVDAVLKDARNDFISIEGAAHDYGVVIEPTTLVVDKAATKTLRAQLKQQRASDPDWLAFGRKQILERTGVLHGKLDTAKPLAA